MYLDRMQIQQVLTNLIRNAVEAMHDSDRRILTVETKKLTDSSVQVSVYDSGSGLPLEVAAKLFGPFVTSQQTGMGLGLSLCKTIVERHNGRIWAESNKGSGTTFRFTIGPKGGDAMK